MDMFEHRFEKEKEEEAPLAARMRPATFHDFVGQGHLHDDDSGYGQGNR